MLALLTGLFFFLFTYSQIQVVTLNGSASSDSDGTISKYQWSQVGTTPSVCTITNATAAIATVVPANGQQWSPGTYTFQLIVTDNQGAVSAPGFTHVTWSSLPPTVEAGGYQIITLPVATTQFKALAMTSLGIVKTWSWSQVAGPNVAVFNRKDTSNVTVAGLIAGIYMFRVGIIDNFGATANDSIQVTVNKANILPKANAGQDQTIKFPTNSVSLGGFDLPSDVAVRWSKVSGPNSFFIVSPFQQRTEVRQLVPGTYVFQKTVTVPGQDLSSSDQVTVTVKKKCTWLQRLLGKCK